MSEVPVAGQTLRQLQANLQTKKFRVVAEIRDIQSMIDVLLSQNSPNDPDCSKRIATLKERLAARATHLQLLEKRVITVTRFSEVQNAEDAMLVLSEVLGALIGCETYALFEFDKTNQELRMMSSLGMADAELRAVSADPQVWELLQAEACAEVVTGEDGVTMIPVKAGDRVVGLLILYRLLPQRWQLESEDHGLLRTIGVAIGESINKFACLRETVPNAV